MQNLLQPEINLSSFSYLFAQLVEYFMIRGTSTTTELEDLLHSSGYDIGLRFLEIICFRDKTHYIRENNLIFMLKFIQKNVWKYLFGKEADLLEETRNEKKDEYYLTEFQPFVNKYISMSKQSQVNCAAFIAGIIHGILEANEFTCTVNQYFLSHKDYPNATLFAIKFSDEVIKRERIRKE